MQEVLDKILAFRKERNWEQYHTPENLAKSIAIEAGELLECFQWDVNNVNTENVKEELADVMLYCLLNRTPLSRHFASLFSFVCKLLFLHIKKTWSCFQVFHKRKG